MTRGLADDVELSLKRVGNGDAGPSADEDLADRRLNAFDRMAKTRVVAGHVTPTEQHLTFVLDGALDLVLASPARCRLLREKHHAHAVFAHRRQRDILL